MATVIRCAICSKCKLMQPAVKCDQRHENASKLASDLVKSARTSPTAIKSDCYDLSRVTPIHSTVNGSNRFMAMPSQHQLINGPARQYTLSVYVCLTRCTFPFKSICFRSLTNCHLCSISVLREQANTVIGSNS